MHPETVNILHKTIPETVYLKKSLRLVLSTYGDYPQFFLYPVYPDMSAKQIEMCLIHESQKTLITTTAKMVILHLTDNVTKPQTLIWKGLAGLVERY